MNTIASYIPLSWLEAIVFAFTVVVLILLYAIYRLDQENQKLIHTIAKQDMLLTRGATENSVCLNALSGMSRTLSICRLALRSCKTGDQDKAAHQSFDANLVKKALSNE